MFRDSCIDEENIQLPPFIKVVPTIYLVNDKKIVIDENIKSWIEEKTKPKQVTDELQAYFGSSSNGYSSTFSNLDNSEDRPYISSFEYLNETDKTINNNNDISKSKDSQFDSKFVQLQKARNMEFSSIQRQ